MIRRCAANFRWSDSKSQGQSSTTILRKTIVQIRSVSIPMHQFFLIRLAHPWFTQGKLPLIAHVSSALVHLMRVIHSHSLSWPSLPETLPETLRKIPEEVPSRESTIQATRASLELNQGVTVKSHFLELRRFTQLFRPRAVDTRLALSIGCLVPF